MGDGKRAEDALRAIRDGRVEAIWLWFCDILGQLKGVAVTPREFEAALRDGMGFDGSSIEGFARIHESDLMARPDASTLCIFLGRDGSPSRFARVFCDLETPDGRPYEGDPRGVLRRTLRALHDQGLEYFVGPEMEYFYFRSPQTRELFDETGYFDASLVSEGTELRRRTVQALEGIGIQAEYAHHEVAPSQHEIDVRYADALTMADQVMTIRFLTREIARESGAYATFMPKPIFGVNGSGMHVHQSVFRGDANLFFDAGDSYNLSPFARSYVAGLLHHVREITLVLNQWVNSYKRLTPGYEAPVYVSWGQRNRSALVRVPRYRVGREKSARIELRSPDPTCNPYLAFSVMLAAGLQGVESRYELPAPVEENIYEMTGGERSDRRIDVLPGSLAEAIALAERSELLRRTLGDHIFGKLLDNKRIEWDRYRICVTPFELEHYLPIM
ncbi:MAG: glutamine synthetase [Deltaproteobacteria bacterium]|nr:glutamine synthetase [Deltaproteobacteria bacterium]